MLINILNQTITSAMTVPGTTIFLLKMGDTTVLKNLQIFPGIFTNILPLG